MKIKLIDELLVNKVNKQVEIEKRLPVLDKIVLK
jgi:hypothetical protein